MTSLWSFLSSKRSSESESRTDEVEQTAEKQKENDSSGEESDQDKESSMDEDESVSTQEEDASTSKEDTCTDRCPQHEKELIQYFCPLHDILGCGVCIMIDHRNCEGVVYIPKVANKFQGSAEFQEFEKDLAELRETSEKIMTSSRENIPKADKNYREALQTMENFRKEKISRLDQMEKELKAKAESCKEENTDRMNSLLNKTAETQNQVCKMMTDMETMIRQKQLCKLYIEMKTAKKQIGEIREALEKLERESFITSYRLVPGKRKLDMLEGLDDEIPDTSNKESAPEPERKKLKARREVTAPRHITAEHVTDICIKSETDKSIVCMVEGLAVIPGNRLVVADKNNCKVKLVDTLQNKIIAELAVPSAPLGVTGINEKQVAVALKSELTPKCDKLLLLKVDRTLKAERLVTCQILVEGDIAFHDDKFLVIRDNGCQVQSIDMVGKGQLIDMEGQSFGCFVAVSNGPAKESVYIASVEHQDNCEEGYVLRKTKLGSEMNCLQAVQNVVFSDLFHMRHAADQTGRVFILGARTLDVMDDEGSEPRTLLSPSDRVYNARCLAVDQGTNKLYVGMSDHNYLKVFKLG